VLGIADFLPRHIGRKSLMGAILRHFPLRERRGRWLFGALAVSALAGSLHAQPRPPATLPATPPVVAPGGSANAVPQQPLSENARDVLARARPAIVQIKGFFGANTAQAFHGTGFAVAPDGVLLTNYHVVAEQVQFPEKYRLEYYTPEGRTGKITVLAIDVLHDLAVVKADGFAPSPMPTPSVFRSTLDSPSPKGCRTAASKIRSMRASTTPVRSMAACRAARRSTARAR
jgi:Trypsin-like peptidase domain